MTNAEIAGRLEKMLADWHRDTNYYPEDLVLDVEKLASELRAAPETPPEEDGGSWRFVVPADPGGDEGPALLKITCPWRLAKDHRQEIADAMNALAARISGQAAPPPQDAGLAVAFHGDDDDPETPSEWERYAFSTFAANGRHYQHGLGVLKARSIYEAQGTADAKNILDNPEANGWRSHKACVLKIEEENECDR
jgi:hypothetical protein